MALRRNRRADRFVARAVVAAAQMLAVATIARAAGPEVSGFLPAGGQRGASLVLDVVGKFPTWPVQTWVDGGGLTLSPLEEKGKLSLVIAADAVPGTRWVRLYDAAGASAPVPLIIGSLPEVLETEPNNLPANLPAPLAAPAVANGRLAGRGDVDLWPVSLRRGQTLVASLAAHAALGSPVDAVMQVLSVDGATLAYNHDQRGLDPQIAFAAPRDGTYLVRVFGFPSTPNQTIGLAGGDSYIYRLTLTTGPFIDYCWPLAVTRGRDASVELVGWNIADGERCAAPSIEPGAFLIAEPRFANTALVRAEPHETTIEAEPNPPDAAQPITLPVTISGRIEAPGDVDAFAFAGRQGEPLAFELASRALGYPLDAVLQVVDAAGASLARVDDLGNDRDPSLTFTPPADGAFRLLVQDLTGAGSARHVYQLRATKAEPTFEVTASGHTLELSPDKPAQLELAIDRRHGFAEEIAFRVEGLPESVSAAGVVSTESGDAAKSVKLTLTTNGGSFAGPLRIVGESSGPLRMSRTATAAVGTHALRCEQLWLTVVAAKTP